MKIIIPTAFLITLFFFVSCTNQDKSEAGTFFLKGNIQFKDKRYEEAIRFYDEAIGKYPKLADAYFNKGLALIQLDRPEEAYESFSQALEIENSFHEARLARAEAALRLKKLIQAEDDLKLLAQTYRDSSHFYLVRGNFYMDQHNTSAAFADFDRAITLDPENAQALVNRGAILFEEGKNTQARDDFEKALLSNPTLKEALNNMGLVLLREHRYEEALGYFDKVLIRVPNDPYALNNKGEALLHLGKTEDAYGFLKRSMEIYPDNGHVLKNLGVYYATQNDNSRAVEYFDKALALEQNVPGLHGLAGKAHWKNNNSTRACQIWGIGKILKDSISIAEAQAHCN